MNSLNIPTAPIGLPDTLAAHKQDVFLNLNVAAVGKITGFDTAKKTASIQILFKALVPDPTNESGGKTVSYPVLVDCPVMTIQGGGAYLQMPIAVGDHCLVIFSDRNLDAWFSYGIEALPMDNRAHDLSDGIAIVGLNALTSTMASYASDEARMVYGTGKIGIKGSKVTVTNGSTTLLTALTGLIDVIKALTVAGAPIDAAGLAALENYKTTLSGFLY